ncbi:hypothetical protein J4457_07540 [Candidatus Woesearchaeota archaeon]|nr:hypothetical protein [Candidatus Woesearchaeota archaeon]
MITSLNCLHGYSEGAVNIENDVVPGNLVHVSIEEHFCFKFYSGCSCCSQFLNPIVGC